MEGDLNFGYGIFHHQTRMPASPVRVRTWNVRTGIASACLKN